MNPATALILYHSRLFATFALSLVLIGCNSDTEMNSNALHDGTDLAEIGNNVEPEQTLAISEEDATYLQDVEHFGGFVLGDRAFPKINNAIKILQDLDPVGVGAKNLKECLLIQNRKSEFENKDLITRIINDFYNAFTNKNFEKIIKELQIGQQELAEVYKNVESLNPIPSSGFSKDKENTEYIIPDFSVKNNDGEVVVKLNTNRKRNIKLSPFYKNLIAETKDEKTKEFLKEKLEKAKWFIESLQKREDTLLNVMNAILEIQEEYFISGAEKDLKPMKLADIAEKVKMDISTISRVTNSKYVETDFGNFLLKDFFSEAYKKDTGEVISTKEIKNKLQEIVNGEDKNSPYTDENLCKLLGQNEFYIARRTVAKYRDELKIPIAKIRRSL